MRKCGRGKSWMGGVAILPTPVAVHRDRDEHALSRRAPSLVAVGGSGLLMENLVRRLLATSMLALLAVPGPDWAERAAENAVATAEDALGAAVGLEQTGI